MDRLPPPGAHQRVSVSLSDAPPPPPPANPLISLSAAPVLELDRIASSSSVLNGDQKDETCTDTNPLFGGRPSSDAFAVATPMSSRSPLKSTAGHAPSHARVVSTPAFFDSLRSAPSTGSTSGGALQYVPMSNTAGFTIQRTDTCPRCGKLLIAALCSCSRNERACAAGKAFMV